MPLTYHTVFGADIHSVRDSLADLRIRVFAEWPYLYRGTHEYEAAYLQPYVDCPGSIAVIAYNGETAVGATTGLPLANAPEEMRTPFHQAGEDVAPLFYFGESVVLAEWRGRGIGREFFTRREYHARQHGYSACVFCAVDRAADDPRRPAGYTGNAQFWCHRGYRKDTARQSHFPWTDLGDTAPSQKTLTFWRRTLPAQGGPLLP